MKIYSQGFQTAKSDEQFRRNIRKKIISEITEAIVIISKIHSSELTVLSNSCNSQALLDLSYQYHCDGGLCKCNDWIELRSNLQTKCATLETWRDKWMIVFGAIYASSWATNAMGRARFWIINWRLENIDWLAHRKRSKEEWDTWRREEVCAWSHWRWSVAEVNDSWWKKVRRRRREKVGGHGCIEGMGIMQSNDS